MLKHHDELSLIALKEFDEYRDMYKIIDFLNKSLKSRGIIFGLTRNNGKDKIAIYDTGEGGMDIIK